MWVKVLLLGGFFILPVVQSESRLRITHTNDMHSRFDQGSKNSKECSKADAGKNQCYGGFTRVLTAVNSERRRAKADNIPFVYLDAGDYFFGTMWYSIFKWPMVAEFIQLLGIDAMCLGNHEFDAGPENLTRFLRNVTVPVLGTNIDFSAEPSMNGAPLRTSTTITRGNLTIGIIGLSSTDLPKLSRTEKVIFTNEVKAARAEIKKLQDEGATIIIALSHCGYTKDLEIAKAVPGLDVIVGGHSHTFLYTGKPPDAEKPAGPYPTMVTQSSGHNVAVVQAYCHTKYLGSLEVVFNNNGEVTNAFGNPILLDSKIVQDEGILAKIRDKQAALDSISKETIANTRVMLNGSCKFNECSMGNLIADAFVDYGVQQLENNNWTGAAISLYHAGAVRATVNPANGVITRGDMMKVMPFFNPLLALSIKGKYILEALEFSVERYDPKFVHGGPSFLQVSGVHVVYDIEQPNGSRVVNLTLRCAQCAIPTYLSLDPEQSYAIVVGSFLAGGGDGFSMIKKHKTVIKEFKDVDTDVVVEYVRNKQLVYTGVEERIQINSSPSTYGIGPINLIFCVIYHFYSYYCH